MAQVNRLPELPPAYNPSETETVVSAAWKQHNVFHADAMNQKILHTRLLFPLQM